MIDIDLNKSKQYTLSIRLSTDGFSFSIYNPIHENSLSVLEKEIDTSLSLTANLKRVFKELEFLTYTYKKVNIIITGKRYTVVPLEMFEDDLTDLLFQHNHSKRENETIEYNILKKSNIVIIFSIDKSTVSFLKDQFPEAKFCSQASSLIEVFSVKSRLGNSKKMYVSLRNEGIDIFCFERGHLLLANSFDCQQTEDKIFYLLYVWKQMDFNQMRDEMHLTGMITDKDKVLKELRKYISQVFIMNPATNIDMQSLLTICE